MCRGIFVYPTLVDNESMCRLRSLASSIEEPCAEKEYLLALVDLSEAVLIAAIADYSLGDSEVESQRYAERLRTEFCDVISSQRYVPSSQNLCHSIGFCQMCVTTIASELEFTLITSSG